MNEELNKKLAEWAGFKYNPLIFEKREFEKWDDPNGHQLSVAAGLPYFTESLDACFKWLVPKANEQGYTIAIKQNREAPKEWLIWLHKMDSNLTITTPVICLDDCNRLALALCLTIEKLIDRDRP